MTPSWIEPGVDYDPCRAGDHPNCPDNIDDMNTCTCPCHYGTWVEEDEEEEVGEALKMEPAKTGLTGIHLFRASTPKSCDACGQGPAKTHDHAFVIAVLDRGARYELNLCAEHLYKNLLAKAITLFEEDRDAKRIDYLLVRRK